eukprot:NODE_6321_length_899_cov_33.061856_g5729_i0.p1 GENE.NODE_6321_length_899_cov_33.061856_g5729_i0~~NODE_6321_length_899_cov_33.061856_g5729_i0.p1  ORF type:complete len:116 (+),score=0.34 NODE_6321_length_899_cov_33.061856_g5729_i0:231-578(+)
MHFLSHFAYGNWGLQALVITEYNDYPRSLKYLPGIGAKEFLENRGYDLSDERLNTSLFGLFFLGLGFRILSFIVLYSTTPQNRIVTRFIEYIISTYTARFKNRNAKLPDLEKPLL